MMFLNKTSLLSNLNNLFRGSLRPFCSQQLSVNKEQQQLSHVTDENGAIITTTEGIPDREFYGCLRQIKTSPQKLNLVAKLIRRMKVSQALVQLEFCEKKAARFVKNALQDTQRRAIETYKADPDKLYVAESFVGKGTYLKRIRYHGRGRSGRMYRYYSHYFLKLKEGKPRVKPQWSKLYNTRRLVERGPLNVPNSL